MQVEGSKKPSDGRLTTSLIAPIAMASPPKSDLQVKNVPPKVVGVHPPVGEVPTSPRFVFLGSQQDDLGAVSYRLGISFPLRETVDLRELSKSLGHSLANGQIPLTKRNEHIHAYVTSVDEQGNRFETHLVIEDKQDGLVAADIAAVDSNRTKGHLQGFISSTGAIPVTEIQPGEPYIVTLRDSDSLPITIDLGKVESFEIEVGSIQRNQPDYVARRIGSELKIYSREMQKDLDDPFGEQPIATLNQSLVASHFPGIQNALRLTSEIAAGNVFSRPNISQTGKSFDPQSFSGSGRSF